MKEADLNTYTKNSFTEKGRTWMSKIPDPTTDYNTIKRPFDLFGCYEGIPVYFEGKFQKGLKAFNFSHIRDHQIENLLELQNISKNYNKEMITGFTLGVYEPRKYFYLLTFEPDLINQLIISEKKSIIKVELLKLINSSKFVSIKKKKFDSSKMIESIISLEDWRNIIDISK